MSFFTAILDCLVGRPHVPAYHPTSAYADVKVAPPHQPMGDEELANDVLDLLLSAEKPGRDLDLRLQELVRPYGWRESLARCILDGLVRTLETGVALGGAAKVAFDKASAVAAKFVKEHPVLTAVIVTVIAIGILVYLAPWVVEALGFGELGPLEGE